MAAKAFSDVGISMCASHRKFIASHTHSIYYLLML